VYTYLHVRVLCDLDFGMKTSFMIFWIVVALCLCVLINVTDDIPLSKSEKRGSHTTFDNIKVAILSKKL
jgi:hypothetical protein